MKHFWQSRKVIYAVATLVVAVVMAVLPKYVGLDQQTVDTLQNLLPGVVAVGVVLIAGHTLTDAVAVWATRPQYKVLKDAVQDVIKLAMEDEQIFDELTDFLKKNGVEL